MSKIEQIIAEIEEYVDTCKFQPLSNSKIIVNRVEIEELIDDLKRSIPDEVKKYQKIIANRDAILKDAQDKAEEMIKKANEMTATLVSEHEIMQQAYKEANSIIENATKQAEETVNTANAQANSTVSSAAKQANDLLNKAVTESNDMKDAATQYLDSYLANIQKILSSSIDVLQARCGDMLRSLQDNLEETTKNRNSLLPVQNPAADNAADEQEESFDIGYGSADPYDEQQAVSDGYADPELENINADISRYSTIQDALDVGDVDI